MDSVSSLFPSQPQKQGQPQEPDRTGPFFSHPPHDFSLRSLAFSGGTVQGKPLNIRESDAGQIRLHVQSKTDLAFDRADGPKKSPHLLLATQTCSCQKVTKVKELWKCLTPACKLLHPCWGAAGLETHSLRNMHRGHRVYPIWLLQPSMIQIHGCLSLNNPQYGVLLASLPDHKTYLVDAARSKD